MSNLERIKQSIETSLNINDISARQILSNLAIILDETKITLNSIIAISFSNDKTEMTLSS